MMMFSIFPTCTLNIDFSGKLLSPGASRLIKKILPLWRTGVTFHLLIAIVRNSFKNNYLPLSFSFASKAWHCISFTNYFFSFLFVFNADQRH